MKKIIIKWGVSLTAVLLLIAVIAAVIGNMQSAPAKYGINGTVDYTDGEEIKVGGSPVLENEMLSLSLDENYAVSVLNKKTGKVWGSSIGEEEVDKFNVSTEASLSSVLLSYLDGNNKSEYSSYIQSVKREQTRVFKLSDDQVRVTYILGERLSDDIIPPALTVKRYEEIYNSVDEEWQEFLDRRYQLFDAKTMTESDNPQEKYELYPNLKKTPLYIISDKNGKVIAEKTKKLFEEIGYTKEDYIKDNELSGYAGNVDECVFKISLDFKLENEDLSVTIPASEIEFYNNTPLLSITPLQFFTSSAGKNGSVLVPDGSGAVMNFSANNTPALYEASIYGRDSTESLDELPADMSTENDTAVSMPVYFFTEENETVMTVIESGAAAATLHINKDEQSVYAYTTFDIVQTGYSSLTENNKTLVCGSDSLKTDIKLRYRFLDGGGYVNSALAYREYLEASSALPKSTVDGSPVFLMETVGAVKSKDGKLLTLSSMSDASDMLKYISDSTGGRITLKLVGMNKNGAFNQIPGEYSYNKKIASEKDFDNLYKQALDTGGFAYLQLNHLYYFDHTFADGFSVKKYTAVMPDKSRAVLGNYNVVEGTYSTSDKKVWIISPKKYQQIAESYITSGFKAIGLGNLAGTVNSDYNRDNYYDRTKSLENAVQVMEAYGNAGIKLAASAANLYSYKYLSLIEDMPLSGGNSAVFDEEVPFCQIVLHGTMDYSTSAINNESDEETAVLKAIETGSGLHYILNKNIENSLFDTDSTALFSSSFDSNAENAAAAYNSVLKALDGLNDKKIVNHYYIGDVAVTVYENGSRIFVNYSDSDAKADNITVPARGWVRAD